MNNEHRTLRHLRAELARVEADRDHLLSLLEEFRCLCDPIEHCDPQAVKLLRKVERVLGVKPARGVYPCGDPELDELALRPEGSVQ